MKHVMLALSFSLLAAPSFAGGWTFDLPNLTFPKPMPPVATQDCARPAAPTCERS